MIKAFLSGSHSVLLFFLFCWAPFTAAATTSDSSAAVDMREERIAVRKAVLALEGQARMEEETAREEARRSRERITGDRSSLEQEITRLEAEVVSLEEAVATLEQEGQQLAEQETLLTERLAATDAIIRELVGVIRMFAKDISSHLSTSLQSALAGGTPALLNDIAEQGRFPGLHDINRMIDLLWQQIAGAASVRLQRGPIVDRSGTAVEADILILGDFTAAYRVGQEIGYLSPSPAGGALFALANLPPRGLRRQLGSYLDGAAEAVPLDITRGAALSQLAHQLNLWQKIGSGGPLIWPILGILLVALLIVGERLLFLWRTRLPADAFTERLAALAVDRNWQACREECRRRLGKPLARVLDAGLDCYRQQRDIMENALQEAILREIPPLERFLSTLGMLAAIAPLLGLLGTVTGMISTFDVITRYGTGDPHMMSGGISEALVTTMLGLSVAIPIMLVHTLLNRTIDNRIAHMEEKAMALINLVQKTGHDAA
ncbi:MotA/TolQ/ExbB proton channel family protein [Desulfofustis glycolicus]|uniref:Biopolymer transport protein ExbB n=1 Tax=Desulfofustis glycolicus DSM 9705 TaxID=1121409 RepID=A0A1M5X1W8_9BACT|nr:MotA/TolQ/ExbB proton channel family protein [Desulfofustis glycolicus]MCB2215561.1 MotA/TolQ/ExbB proton channel family protein [Desulfobulbaceae bacterium]SHH93730.1 biopolymer transport protein ExbB [Desulfofustis glycolicus DSM 9705]